MVGQQLAFSTVLNSERRPELQIPVNSSVKLKDKLRLRGQASRIYNLLKERSATTSELAAIGLQYSARINEVRHALIKEGAMIDELPGESGENRYRIVPLGESTFWRRVKQKGEQWKWVEKVTDGNRKEK
jgi:hypothetical protein